MVVTVRQLEPLPEGGIYELFLTDDGRRVASCGTFNVEGEKTVVTLNAPFKLRGKGWVVVARVPGKPEREVLTTV